MENVTTGAKAINLHFVFCIVFCIAGFLGTIYAAVTNSHPIYFGLVWGGALIVALFVIASLAMGSYTVASAYASTAMGNQTQANGLNSTAMGFKTTALSFCEVAIGQYNTVAGGHAGEWNDSDRLFVIGNGTGDNARSDALVVKKNGDLEVNGDVTCQNIHQTSDARVKDWEGMDAGECLAGIVALEPGVYSFKPSYVAVAGGSSTSKQMGLLAQPLEEVFPHAVHTAETPTLITADETVPDMKSVNYASLVAPLIGAVKALSAENRGLQDEMKALSAENRGLQDEMKALVARVQNLESAE
jgi:hypothetical protein